MLGAGIYVARRNHRVSFDRNFLRHTFTFALTVQAEQPRNPWPTFLSSALFVTNPKRGGTCVECRRARATVTNTDSCATCSLACPAARMQPITG